MASETTAENKSTPLAPEHSGSQTYERAKKRLAAVDAKSDGSPDGDEELRQEALRFIEKECLSLPDDEFMRLLEKIEAVLKRKDAEIGSVIVESKSALREISEELSLKPLANFDPNVSNPSRIADYVANAMLTVERTKAFTEMVESNADCAI